MSDFAEQLLSYRATRNQREAICLEAMSPGDADRYMSDLLSHTAEELFELRLCLNRKSWKPQPSIIAPEGAELRAKALEELADVLLMLDSFRDAAGWTLAEVQQAVLDKAARNLTRLDHIHNAQSAHGAHGNSNAPS